MRQVAGPDDQVLGEREVRPQHHEGEHQVPEIVKVRRDDDAIERRAAAQPHERRRSGRPCAESPCPPMISTPYMVENQCGLDRHQPVERRERDGDAVRDKATAAHDLHPARDARIAGAILLERQRVEDVGQAVPDQEIDRGSDEKERRVQVGLLVLKQFVAGRRRRRGSSCRGAPCRTQSAGRAASSPASRATRRRSAAG